MPSGTTGHITGIANAFGSPYGGENKGDFENHPHIDARNAGKLLTLALGAQHYEALAGLGFRV